MCLIFSKQSPAEWIYLLEDYFGRLHEKIAFKEGTNVKQGNVHNGAVPRFVIKLDRLPERAIMVKIKALPKP